MSIEAGSLLYQLDVEDSSFRSALSNAERAAKTSADRMARDIGQIDRAFENSARSAGRAEQAFRALAGAGAGQALGAGLQRAATDASNLVEALNRVDTQFESSAGTVRAWSKTTATSLGLSQRAALEAAGSFGGFFQAAGLAGEAAAKASTDIVGLSADLASYFNVAGGAEQVTRDLQSGLSGQHEVLRRYNVFITEASLTHKALQLGLAATASEIDEQDKILARSAIIWESTTKAQGDFLKTSDRKSVV